MRKADLNALAYNGESVHTCRCGVRVYYVQDWNPDSGEVCYTVERRTEKDHAPNCPFIDRDRKLEGKWVSRQLGDLRNNIVAGDAEAMMRYLADESCQTCVTSPPYWGLRDYGIQGQIGLEMDPQQYLDRMVVVFRQVHRLLAKDGILWLNMGDTRVNGKGSCFNPGGDKASVTNRAKEAAAVPLRRQNRSDIHRAGMKEKELAGIPWRLALALQADGWFLRQDIIWHKPNPMPESVKVRFTSAHEYIFMLTKSKRYYFDQQAILEAATKATAKRVANMHPGQAGSLRAHAGARGDANPMRPVGRRIPSGWNTGEGQHRDKVGRHKHTSSKPEITYTTRNKRSVWTIATRPFRKAHFATFPLDIPEICIKASTVRGDVVLDPFAGAGTTCLAAKLLGRFYFGIDLNPDYVKLAKERVEESIYHLKPGRNPLQEIMAFEEGSRVG